MLDRPAVRAEAGNDGTQPEADFGPLQDESNRDALFKCENIRQAIDDQIFRVCALSPTPPRSLFYELPFFGNIPENLGAMPSMNL